MHPHVELAHARGGRPVDVAHGIPGPVGADAVDQKRIALQLALEHHFADEPGKWHGQIAVVQQPRIDRDGGVQPLLAAALEEARDVAGGQGRAADVVFAPMQELHPVPPRDALIRHQREQALVIHAAADVEVLLAAELQVAGDPALHAQPRHDQRAVVADDLHHLALFALEHLAAGKRAGTGQPPQGDALEQQAVGDAQSGEYREHDQHVHAIASVGTDTRPSRSRMNSSASARLPSPRRTMR